MRKKRRAKNANTVKIKKRIPPHQKKSAKPNQIEVLEESDLEASCYVLYADVNVITSKAFLFQPRFLANVVLQSF